VGVINVSNLVARSLVIVAILFGVASANAQCGPNKKIYIDPRLVPQWPAITPEQQRNISAFMANPWAPDWQKKDLADNLAQQQRLANEPIVMPYTGGRVLINPQNPCIQFIPD
jgi:hypothetical protein